MNDTGAFSDFSNMSLRTGWPSTKSWTSLERRSVIGASFAVSTVKGIIT